ncbi:baseplate J/gp47 family protein [Crassaminicella thermophila]|uniref:Baseplate J/gp47 family protein n=1 Tax=Crassaminicella thermophila TaxID=2599308 RepID=A0A5C0SF57_CRATE|nr:baseplate J/gp47 family protein [Crassaminicella thermophila]QEK12572.1 baseplate J/gp47 family protein [Crassaminicella thermophila]
MADDRDTIQNRMLQNISDEYDKTEGSFFYDVLKSVAIELENAYKKQESILDKGFVETATGEWLDKKVAEQGLTRKSATKATTIVTITGSEGTIVNEGTLVASDTVNFVVKETKTIDATGQVDVLVECEEEGSIGNVPAGAIKYFPVTIAGLTGVTNLNAVTNGYDGETDEELRQRYFDKVRTPATSGNKWHYRNWAKEVTGVGDARVFPLANGPGTVKVMIIDSNKTGAEQELIDAVYNHIEENRPIGATVTVVSATEVPININVTLTIDTDNYAEQEVITNIENNITAYLKEIAFVEDYVSYAKVGSIILDTIGVLDYSNLIVNGGTSNITIADNEVAVLGGVTNV